MRFLLTIIFLSTSDFSIGTDLSMKCDNDSNAFYWRSSCYVFDVISLNKQTANNNCNQYGRGHLAFITTPTLAQLTDSFANPLTPSTLMWIGLDESAPGTNIWRWIEPSTGKKWKLAPKATGVPMYRSTEPNNLVAETGGVFLFGTKEIGNYYATSGRPTLCQYHDIVTPYQGIAMNARAPSDYVMLQMNDTIMERCAFRCNENRPCQSFSHNPSTNHCQLNWWAGIDITTEYVQDYIIFDKE